MSITETDVIKEMVHGRCADSHKTSSDFSKSEVTSETSKIKGRLNKLYFLNSKCSVFEEIWDHWDVYCRQLSK